MVISELAPPATAQVISMQHPQILNDMDLKHHAITLNVGTLQQEQYTATK
jgi:hypothetical protein